MGLSLSAMFGLPHSRRNDMFARKTHRRVAACHSVAEKQFRGNVKSVIVRFFFVCASPLSFLFLPHHSTPRNDLSLP